MAPPHDEAFTQLKYSFSELCLADKSSAAERVKDIVRDLGWDVERVEGNRPAIAAAGEGMRMHLRHGLAHLEHASRELDRLGLKAQKDECEKIIQDCMNGSRGHNGSTSVID
jgi:hypothetical protein